MLLSIALSIARRRRGLADASPPPSRAATVISLMRRVKILPRFASVAAFLCLMFAHLLWPAMASSALRALVEWRELYRLPRGRRRSRPAAARARPASAGTA